MICVCVSSSFVLSSFFTHTHTFTFTYTHILVYYRDPFGVIPKPTSNGINTDGTSMNVGNK